MEAIRILNERLQAEEERITYFYDKLEKDLDSLEENKTIDMSNVYVHIALYYFSEEDLAAQKNSARKVPSSFEFSMSDWRKNNDDWSSLYPGFPFKVCYTLHCILSRSLIAKEYLNKIEDVCISILVDYSFWNTNQKPFQNSLS